MPRVQPPRSSSGTDTGIMFNCFCKWSELKPPNSIPRGNQACFHHTGWKRVREPVTSTTLGTMQHVATLMPLTGLTSAHFVTRYKRIALIEFFFQCHIPPPSQHQHQTRIWWRNKTIQQKNKKFHGFVLFCRCAGHKRNRYMTKQRQALKVSGVGWRISNDWIFSDFCHPSILSPLCQISKWTCT